MRTELITRGLDILRAACEGKTIYEPQCSIVVHAAIAQLHGKGWLVRNPFNPRQYSITPLGRAYYEGRGHDIQRRAL